MILDWRDLNDRNCNVCWIPQFKSVDPDSLSVVNYYFVASCLGFPEICSAVYSFPDLTVYVPLKLLVTVHSKAFYCDHKW